MKIHENLKQKEVQTTNFERMKVSDSLSDLIFKIFTKSFYSNPIGSVVREITSNAFDANVAAGRKESPIVIRLESTDEGKQISFIDNGTGMNEEKLKEVYFTLWESDKRETNNFIGGWGIGSKTPLAYNRYNEESQEYDDSYTVTSVCDGRLLSYFIFFDNSTINYSKIEDKKVDMPNGTIVTVPVLDSHIYRFVQEITKQICYFDNLVFDGFDRYSDKLNSYKVYEFKNFKVSTLSEHDEIHLNIGNVSYPLKKSFFRDIENIDSAIFDNNIGLKFDIGELGVTESREDVEYNDESVKLIAEKIIAARNEIYGIFYNKVKSNPTVEEWFTKYANIFNGYYSGYSFSFDDDIFNVFTIKLTKEEKEEILNKINKDDVTKYTIYEYFDTLIYNLADITSFNKGRKEKRFNFSKALFGDTNIYFIDYTKDDIEPKEINKRKRYVKHINGMNNYFIIQIHNSQTTIKSESGVWMIEQLKDYITDNCTDILSVEKPKNMVNPNKRRKANRRDLIIKLKSSYDRYTNLTKIDIGDRDFYFQGLNVIYMEYSEIDNFLSKRKEAFILLNAFYDYDVIAIPKYLKKVVELNADNVYHYEAFYKENKHKIFETKELFNGLLESSYHNLRNEILTHDENRMTQLSYDENKVYTKYSKYYEKNKELFDEYFRLVNSSPKDITYYSRIRLIDEKEYDRLIKKVDMVVLRMFNKHKKKLFKAIREIKSFFTVVDTYYLRYKVKENDESEEIINKIIKLIK